MPEGAEKDRFYDDWELKKRATQQQVNESRGGPQPAVMPLYATVPKIPREATKFASDKDPDPAIASSSGGQESAEIPVRSCDPMYP